MHRAGLQHSVCSEVRHGLRNPPRVYLTGVGLRNLGLEFVVNRALRTLGDLSGRRVSRTNRRELGDVTLVYLPAALMVNTVHHAVDLRKKIRSTGIPVAEHCPLRGNDLKDRKSTRLNSSH